MQFQKLLECNSSFVIFKVFNSGKLNTIMTFYDITDPPVESDLINIPVPLLRKAIAILGKTGRSQMISITDGEGVRFLAKQKCMGYIAFIETLALSSLTFLFSRARTSGFQSQELNSFQPLTTTQYARCAIRTFCLSSCDKFIFVVLFTYPAQSNIHLHSSEISPC